MPSKRVKRSVWVVVYERRESAGSHAPTLRESYWSRESAEDRARDLLPHCSAVFVGLMEEWDTASLDDSSGGR